jgi:hypothetical protein
MTIEYFIVCVLPLYVLPKEKAYFQDFMPLPKKQPTKAG